MHDGAKGHRRFSCVVLTRAPWPQPPATPSRPRATRAQACPPPRRIGPPAGAQCGRGISAGVSPPQAPAMRQRVRPSPRHTLWGHMCPQTCDRETYATEDAFPGEGVPKMCCAGAQSLKRRRQQGERGPVKAGGVPRRGRGMKARHISSQHIRCTALTPFLWRQRPGRAPRGGGQQSYAAVPWGVLWAEACGKTVARHGRLALGRGAPDEGKRRGLAALTECQVRGEAGGGGGAKRADFAAVDPPTRSNSHSDDAFSAQPHTNGRRSFGVPDADARATHCPGTGTSGVGRQPDATEGVAARGRAQYVPAHQHGGPGGGGRGGIQESGQCGSAHRAFGGMGISEVLALAGA